MRCSLYVFIALCLTLALPSEGQARSRTSTSNQLEQGSAELKVAQRRGKRSKKARTRLARARTRKSRRAAARRARMASASKPEPSSEVRASSGDTPIATSHRSPARVDFDDRLIQGQSNRAGAIYIFERQSAELHTMVKRRKSFRDEILRTIN